MFRKTVELALEKISVNQVLIAIHHQCLSFSQNNVNFVGVSWLHSSFSPRKGPLCGSSNTRNLRVSDSTYL